MINDDKRPNSYVHFQQKGATIGVAVGDCLHNVLHSTPIGGKTAILRFD